MATTLFDAYGQPVDLGSLKQELAAPGLTQVRQVLSNHPSTGLTPLRLGRLLRASEEGDADAYLELAEDMEEKDLTYRSLLQTRKLACSGLEPVVEAASDGKEDQDDADLIREVLSQEGIEDALMDILDALGKGYSATEILWDVSGKVWMPQLVHRDPRWFRFDRMDGRSLRLLEGGLPVPLAPYKFIVHTPRMKSGLPIRGGLARAAAWAFLFGNYVLKDWVSFAEVFGQPIRLGKYPAGTAKDQVDILKAAVANIGTDCGAVIPDGMMLEIVEAAGRSSSADLYEKLLRHLHEMVTLAVLGQTLTSGQSRGGGGSMALGNVHNEIRKDLLKADARQLAATLNRDLVRPVIDLNRGPRMRYPRVRLHVEEPEDLTALADQLAKLIPMGLKVEQSVIRDKWGLPDPGKGEDVELLGMPAAPAPPALPGIPVQDSPGSTAQARQCPNCSSHARGPASRDQVDDLTDHLEAQQAEVVGRMLEPVRRLVMSAQSMEEIRDGLLDLYPQMDSEAFAHMFSEALTASVLLGRVEVGRGRS